jgi:hypothetical protein
LVYPLVIVFVWVAIALLYRGYKLRRQGKREKGGLEGRSTSSRSAEASQDVESERLNRKYESSQKQGNN